MSVIDSMYPETQAGGFCRVDHRMSYLVRVNAVLEPDMTLLDLGAGRGKWQYDGAPLRAYLGDFRNRCKHVIAADVDPVVMENPMANECIVLEPGKPFPVADESVDVVSSFSVFEHIEDPEELSRELDRILKPGGWIFGWTPNRWGYVAMGATMVPRRLHSAVLRIVEPERHEEDTFPTFYRLNSPSKFKQYFPPDRFDHMSYTWNGFPFYHGERKWAAYFWKSVLWALPDAMGAYWHVVIRKKP